MYAIISGYAYKLIKKKLNEFVNIQKILIYFIYLKNKIATSAGKTK